MQEIAPGNWLTARAVNSSNFLTPKPAACSMRWLNSLSAGPCKRHSWAGSGALHDQDDDHDEQNQPQRAAPDPNVVGEDRRDGWERGGKHFVHVALRLEE